jgi:5-methyltetrahydrofolate--homocysteine methyltransferase
MSRFLEQLETKRLLVADGATGTNLQKSGLRPGEHPEGWVLANPEKIMVLERAFVEAGSDIILTCTFGGTRLRLAGTEYADRVSDINRKAATLARAAASEGKDVLVGGSMGPLGKLLKPYGPVSVDEAVAAYTEQAAALADGGVDVLVIETQFALDEAAAAVKGARSVSDLPLVVSFSFDRGTRTMMGVRPADVARAFAEPGVAVIGANCGTTLANAESVLKEYAFSVPDYPLWAKPNAGMPRVEGEDTVYDVTPEGMAEFADAAIQIGARIVGGCCGSAPEHVRAIARAVHRARAGDRNARQAGRSPS